MRKTTTLADMDLLILADHFPPPPNNPASSVKRYTRIE